MNTRLLSYIDTFLYHSSTEPLQQLVYIIAKLCLITAPAAWVVKRPTGKDDRLFTSQEKALEFLEKQGHSDDYVAPLFTTVKVDMSAGEIQHLLLTPLPDEED